MGVKGKLIVSLEVKCGGHSVHDIFHINTHHLPNISPSRLKHFEIHEGEIGKIDSVVSWKYNEDGKEMVAKTVIEAIDPSKKSITWKVIEGHLLELYNSFTIITSCEHWTTIALVYEKKTEDTPEPLALLDYFVGMTKDVEGHLLKK
ncbi:MLP-like protein 28 isoform X2 [Solanum stenotomum]|uniref:MLP-like protein 28 isoform X2 n=1 Tax=Solanum stenotomum TaxID=172797 RepID=UPI0020D023E4|nr:MLP-like protein 28 isoform X2 [Solanum stenotomum]